MEFKFFGILLLFDCFVTSFSKLEDYSVPGEEPTPKQKHVPSSVTNYLERFGYLPPADSQTGNLRSISALSSGICRLQRFAGLNCTGEIDRETEILLKTKRCGLPDYQYEEDALENLEEFTSEKEDESGDGAEESWIFLDPKQKHKRRHHGRRRSKRFIAQGSVWGNKRITYKIDNFSPDLGPSKVRRSIHDALKLWSDASALEFVETNSEDADIKVKFERGNHGDGYPFDGPNIVLAHAFFPGRNRGGDVHFDEDEKWTDKGLVYGYDEAVNLFSVAAHEFGHSLGLSHSNKKGALMYPYYQAPVTKLPYDDTLGIQELYGRGNAGPPTVPPEIPTSTTILPSTTPPASTTSMSTTTGPPTPCDSHIDAISKIRNEIFIFKGKYFWRFDEEGYLVEKPFPIDHFWTGFPENLGKIDAFYEIKDRDEIVFFSGRFYWIFVANNIKTGYPKDISTLGLSDSVERIDGAFIWGYNKKTYLFSGDQYWRFDENSGTVDLDYPRNIGIWKGVPYSIDAVFTDHDDKTYFFKDDLVYQFNSYFMRVEKRYPIPVRNLWTHCTGNSNVRMSLVSNFAQRTTVGKPVSILLGVVVVCFYCIVLLWV